MTPFDDPNDPPEPIQPDTGSDGGDGEYEPLDLSKLTETPEHEQG